MCLCLPGEAEAILARSRATADGLRLLSAAMQESRGAEVCNDSLVISFDSNHITISCSLVFVSFISLNNEDYICYYVNL